MAPFLIALVMAAATTQPAGGVIQGTVRSEGEVPLSEMVVYLECLDEGKRLQVPDQPVEVSQKGAQFSPALTVITAGQSVKFLNDESRLVEHNVFSNAPAKRFDLGLFGPGENRTVTFDKPGPVFLYCSIHKFMDGVVYVCPTPFFSTVTSDGAYKIADVPPGKYVLHTWQRRRRFPEQTIPVTVDAAASAQTIDLELRRK